MIGTIDALSTLIVPFVLGVIAALSCSRITKVSACVGIWTSVVTCYVMRLSVDEWNALPADARSVSGVATCLKAAFAQICLPTTALMWIPLAATGVLMFATIDAYFKLQSPSSRQQRSRLVQFCLFCGILTLSTILMARALWSSIYLTSDYSIPQKLGWVVVPAFLLAAIWFTGAVRNRSADDSQTGLVSLALLSLSTCVLLASSGTLSYALFTSCSIAFSLILLPARHFPKSLASQSSGFVAVTIALPVILGYFFADVSLLTGLSLLLSLLLLMFLWPLSETPVVRRWAMALLPTIPGLFSAIHVAFGMMNKIQSEPSDYYNAYTSRVINMIRLFTETV